MSAELVAISQQLYVVGALLAGAGIVTGLSFLKDTVLPAASKASSSSSRRAGLNSPTRAWSDPDDVDHQKVYLLAPTPTQRWTSHYAHPRSELSPSFHTTTEADEARLADLLTPSKDWWTGHKTGTARNTPSALRRPDFSEADETTTTTTTTTSTRTASSKKRSSRTSRRSNRQPEPEVEVAPVEEAQAEPAAEPEAVEPDVPDHSNDYDFAIGGGDADDQEEQQQQQPEETAQAAAQAESSSEADSFSAEPPRQPTSASRRQSGTPSRHRRQWTHTIVPGIEEQRIHRKGGRNLF